LYGVGHYLPFGFLPVANDLPVTDWAIRAALPGSPVFFFMAVYIFSTLVPFGMQSPETKKADPMKFYLQKIGHLIGPYPKAR
jgi:hypothetical protein